MVARLVEKEAAQVALFPYFPERALLFGCRNMNLGELILNFCFKKLIRRDDMKMKGQNKYQKTSPHL